MTTPDLDDYAEVFASGWWWSGLSQYQLAVVGNAQGFTGGEVQPRGGATNDSL